MARVLRKLQKIFALNANNNGQFGSAQAGTKILSNDVAVIQNLPAWPNGFNDATISSQRLPTLEEMQALHYVTTSQLAYLFQEGVPEWETGTTYYQYSVVKKPGSFELYGSLTDANQGNALPSGVSNSNWKYLGMLGDSITTAETSSTDGQLYVANGTGGKALKKSSLTGLLKATSGVVSSAISGADYLGLTNSPGFNHSNLKISTTSDATGTVTADSVVLSNGTNTFLATSVNVNFSIATSGAGGLDTGSEAANSFYHVFLVWNGTTLSTLLSLSSTAPTLPSGYTYKKRIGTIRNDASSNFWRTLQYNDELQIVVGTNPANTLIAASGGTGGAYTAASLTSLVPPNASHVFATLSSGASAASVAPNAAYGPAGSFTNIPPVSTGATASVVGSTVKLALESSSIYYASASAGAVAILGWKDNL